MSERGREGERGRERERERERKRETERERERGRKKRGIVRNNKIYYKKKKKKIRQKIDKNRTDFVRKWIWLISKAIGCFASHLSSTPIAQSSSPHCLLRFSLLAIFFISTIKKWFKDMYHPPHQHLHNYYHSTNNNNNNNNNITQFLEEIPTFLWLTRKKEPVIKWILFFQQTRVKLKAKKLDKTKTLPENWKKTH